MSGKGAKVAKKGAKKNNTNRYKLPDPIPNGEVLTDLGKKQWIIGPSIGVGGFGEIYSAAAYTGGKPKSHPYVVKIEPHENGPLFVEMHFYMRNAKPADIEAWKTSKNLSVLGMPSFISSGSHECHGTKYRFVVMEKYGRNLWDLFVENNRKFPEPTVYKIALQIINVLEYIHDKNYVHADVKGANLLLSLKSNDQVFLVDFGLASHVTTKTEYKLDPKKAHNGTIEYTSRDAHMGIATMRSDIEILAYNMIQWLTGSLPWENCLTDPAAVQKQKENAFSDMRTFLKACFPAGIPDTMEKFMKLLSSLKFNEKPNYERLRDVLVKGIQNCGEKPDGKLDFAAAKKPPKSLFETPTPTKVVNKNTRKSPRIQNKPSPNSTADELNDSSNLGSVIIQNKKRAPAINKKRILKNVEITDDSDMEIEIKITKKRKNKPDVVKKTVIRNRTNKLGKEILDLDETVSDDPTQVGLEGSKPQTKNTRKRRIARVKPGEKLEECNDSMEDMFDDDNHADEATPPKTTAKSWKDLSSVKNSNVTTPGKYKRVNKM